MDRRDKINYYLDLAEVAAERSTCLRRMWGSVIVNNDEIVSTGYNGAPRGRINCNELNYCTREKLNIPRGTRYELCRSVHSEANAIISASRKDTIGATLYMVGLEAKSREYVKNACSCAMCKRLIINAGISKIIVRNTKDEYSIFNVEDFIKNDESLEMVEGY